MANAEVPVTLNDIVIGTSTLDDSGAMNVTITDEETLEAMSTGFLALSFSLDGDEVKAIANGVSGRDIKIAGDL